MQFADFDPYNGAPENNIIAGTLYSNLIEYDKDLTPKPDVATEWTMAPDRRSVTITLRETTFGDKTPLTAADVVEGVKRATDPKTALTVGGVSSFIDSAQAVDDHSVKVTFKEPTGEDRVLDWMFYFPVVKSGGNDPEKLKTQPAGSGPYLLDSYQPGDRMVLKANPDYYDAAKVSVKKVVYQFFNDQDSLVAALQSGDVDGTAFQELRYDQQLKGRYQLIDGSESAATMLFYLNPTKAPFDDADCRRAVMRAVDRDKILQAVQGKTGTTVPGPFPPSSPAYDASLMDEVGFDAAAAKSGIAASCSTKSATAVVQPSPGVSQGLTIVQADLAAAGFDLRLQNVDSANFATQLRAGKVQTAMFITVNPFRSPASLATNRGFSGGEGNYWWFGKGVPENYQKALTAVQQAITDDQQKAANDQFNRALLEASWTTGIYTQINRFAMADHVKGFRVNPVNHLILDDVTVG
ncbi:ABC transporter substrate-binding protein [Streptomyces tagetis]|uniref:ABC transporter substrate-binding protein n=1 Tax=Streptomyces tagetis TaxID=2820809 RepID=A0A940XF01_9ACTN|nr:ABC transporter substrate-binding protein [Streptomyces sp. RG38]MBQ0827220.1 ABC transporter substrate-binding protein [Streptomyces sp. RG38]